MLVQKQNKRTKKTEWAMVSKNNPNKVLRWFGTRKPSKARFAKEERRVQTFAHK